MTTTTLASMVADVVTITNRPDLSDLITLNVKKATLKAHQADDWIFDIVEQSIAFTASDYYQSLVPTDLFPLWRKPKYVRIYDYSIPPGTPGLYLEAIDPKDSKDGYGYDKTNVYYVAGTSINIRSFAKQQYYLLGFLQNPNVTSSGYSSWIADQFPDAIQAEAALMTVGNTGYQEQVALYKEQLAEAYKLLTIHAISAEAA